jgi:hypothetical protein
VPAQRETERPIRKCAGEKATNQKARRRKSDQSKACLLRTAMRATNEKARQHQDIESKSVPVQTGINHAASIKLPCNHKVCLLKQRPIKKRACKHWDQSENINVMKARI